MNLQTYQEFLAEVNRALEENHRKKAQLTETKRFLEEAIAQAQSRNGNASASGIYAEIISVADAAKAYLMSVHGAWRKDNAIAKALKDGGFKTQSKNLTSNISTALKRRITSAISPDREIVKGEEGWAYRPADTAMDHQ